MADEEDGPGMSDTPPSYSLVKVWRTLKSKGFLKALEDPEHGPHVHLTFVLLAILLTTILIIGIYSLIV